MEGNAGAAKPAGGMSKKVIAIVVVAVLLVAAVAGVLLLTGGGSSNDKADNWLDKGFNLELFYNSGNTARQTACEILKTNLESLNPGKIKVTVTPLEWSVYMQYRQQGKMPAMFLGWAPDYADPDDYVQPFYLSSGTYASMIGYENTTLDQKIMDAAAETNETLRAQMYKDISMDMYEECVFVWTAQPTNFFAGRSWVNGYYFNPMFSNLYYYDLSKNASMSPANPDTFIFDTISGNPESFDPAVGYETVGGELFQNIYETLVFYDGASAVDLKGQLATEVPTVENGGVSADGMTYTYNLRTEPKFSNGNELTAEDVVYTFERIFALNDGHSPAWMVGQVMIPDYYNYGMGSWNETTSQWDWAIPQDVIAQSIWAVDEDTVQINLTQPYPAFNYVLAYNIGSIVDKEFVESIGGISDDGYKNMNKPENMIGTGPYMMDTFASNDYTKLVANPDYWQGEAALTNVLINQVNEAATRIQHLKQGDADAVHVPRQQKADVENVNGITVVQGNPTFDIEFLGLNQDLQGLNETSPDKTNVPADFFADKNVRLAFAHAFDYQTYINNVLKGTAIQPNGAIPKGMFGYSADVPVFDYNLEKAKAYLKAAKCTPLPTEASTPMVEELAAVVSKLEA